MSVNRHKPHVYVLPEDDANRQLANGFHLNVDAANDRQMQVLPVAGGWLKVLDLFVSDHVREMDRFSHRLMVLLIDFDGRNDRLLQAQARIPPHLRHRVFILGTLSEPQSLRPDLGSFETIGSGMARDCREGTDTIWGHNLLRHNTSELDRLREHVCPILFPPI
ncbi:MAG: hypothetical protein LAP38_25370 [Acidobacteriia bacterium]|nr:hypothetical protein [Terriglobia bacterium]